MSDEDMKAAAELYKRLSQNECTLRDQFAMAALTGLLAYPERSVPATECARRAYQVADAMMAAREVKS